MVNLDFCNTGCIYTAAEVGRQCLFPTQSHLSRPGTPPRDRLAGLAGFPQLPLTLLHSLQSANSARHLVPGFCLDWSGNARYGDHGDFQPVRLVLRASPPAPPAHLSVCKVLLEHVWI